MSTLQFKQEIIFLNGLTESSMVGISKYWAFVDGYFKYELKELNKQNFQEESVLEDVLTYSKCILTFDKCVLCHSSIVFIASNREEFLKLILIEQNICNNCKAYSPNYNNKLIANKPIELSIKELSESEVKVLKGIVMLKSKMLIYRHIFNNDIDDKQIWNVINTLQSKGLISIERDSSWKIKSFNFNAGLSKLL